jgi:hypothetical protein
MSEYVRCGDHGGYIIALGYFVKDARRGFYTHGQLRPTQRWGTQLLERMIGYDPTASWLEAKRSAN